MLGASEPAAAGGPAAAVVVAVAAPWTCILRVKRQRPPAAERPTVLQRSSSFAVLKPLVLGLVLIAFSVAPVSAQTADLHTLDDVLEVTKVRSILGGMPDQFIFEFEQAQPGASIPDDVRRLAAVYFADSTLYRYVLEGMRERADGDVVPALSEWLFSEWAAAARDAVDGYEPEKTLEEYAAGLQTDPPRQDRVRLMVGFVQANEAGPFYVGLAEAQRDAVRSVAAALGDDDLAALPEPTEEEEAEVSNYYSTVALLSFLQRYAPLSDEQVDRLTSAYESESGRWYVRSYSESVADAIRRAGRELAGAL